MIWHWVGATFVAELNDEDMQLISNKQAAKALPGKNSGDVVLPITDKQAAMALRDICTYNYEQSWEPYS